MGKCGEENYLVFLCDFVISFVSEWESSDEYLRPAKPVQVQGISKTKSMIFFSLEMK